MSRQFVALLVLIVAPFGANARLDPAVCGTHREKTNEELFLHRRAARLRTAGTLQARAKEAAARDVGQIALIDDSDGVVGHRNPFDLNQQTLRFIPTSEGATKYRFELGEASYDAGAAASGARVKLGDDDTHAIALRFNFPFFGAVYRKIYVNSDGNATFTGGDADSTDRSFGRFAGGVPRLAPLFADLDPSSALTGQGVFVTSEQGRFVVSWVNVPEYSMFGGGRPETFQMRLYPDGRIEFTWQDVDLTDAVVGIAPGRQAGSSVVSFADGGSDEFSTAVGERFSGSDSVDIVAAAQQFYASHEDAYDYLVIFNAEGVQAAPGAVAYEVTVRNQRTGFGDALRDIGLDFGSRRRLQAVLNMGPLNQYPVDPTAVVPARFLSRDTTLSVLGHEAGHLFLAFASVKDPNDPEAKPMLGRALVHWSFLFNSEASLLEGNRIKDNGVNASPRFTTVATVEGYAPLDQYLMGFRAADEVPATFLVTDAPFVIAGQSPQPGVSFDGKRRDITVEDVIDVVGRRTPDETVSQRRFRFAFLLIVPAGAVPSPDEMAQLDNYRSLFENYYQHATSDRAVAETSLQRALHFSAYPAAGLLNGAAAAASLSLDTAADVPLTVMLHSDSGRVGLPSSVTIPAGGDSVEFLLMGERPGVDTVTAEPADTGYETAFAKIQVAAGAAALQLQIVSGENQVARAGLALPEPIVLRVTDINNLPYPSILVEATVTSGGLKSSTGVTDANGMVRFNWTPGDGPIEELTASVAGGPNVVVAALGRPGISAGGVVNAASYVAEISPGSIATLFGTSLAGARVSINGVGTTVFYSDNRQVNFLVPADPAGDAVEVTVTTAAGTSGAVSVPVAAVSPGLFAAVQRGQSLEVFGTGLGPLKSGKTVNPVKAFIDSVEAEVTYSGAAPGFPGLNQVNVKIPDGTAAGPHSVNITIAGKQSNTIMFGKPSS